MKSINELYLILWERIKDSNMILGLCCEIKALGHTGILTTSETNRLMRSFQFNKPSEILHTDFYKHSSYNPTSKEHNFWWKIHGAGSLGQRKLFIQRMISITSNNHGK